MDSDRYIGHDETLAEIKKTETLMAAEKLRLREELSNGSFDKDEWLKKLANEVQQSMDIFYDTPEASESIAIEAISILELQRVLEHYFPQIKLIQ